MLTQIEFDKLSTDLRTLAVKIPLRWGSVQNNHMDDHINMFTINHYEDLESNIAHLSEEDKNYLRRRWYLWQCSQCDEYLFYVNDNVEMNPNRYDKSYDIRINGNLIFDVKGTVIPKEMRDDAERCIKDPAKLIKFYYTYQSTGRRYEIQNRLFIVHHSFVDPKRELLLRCAWGSKAECYAKFASIAHQLNYFNYKDEREGKEVICGVIFILERKQGEVECIISSD